MKNKKLNKAVDLGLSELTEKGLKVNLVVPTDTLIGISMTIIFTTLILNVTLKLIKRI